MPKPVLMLAPESNSMNADEAGYLEDLISQNWLSRQYLQDCVFDDIINKLNAVRALPFNPLDALAQNLKDRLSILNST
ncbi:MAG: hypothetical protein HC850_10760 [Rhodomicrobium sp.]|nr:hypothetical protein [Rhodomicrobium sp.]